MYYIYTVVKWVKSADSDFNICTRRSDKLISTTSGSRVALRKADYFS